jgi:predicted Zn-dependent protease
VDPGSIDEGAIDRDLVAVIDRFRGDGRVALGVPGNAGSDAVRAAFMTLCKRYHPAKFARRSPSTLRLANEAFLAIRRAYDEVQRSIATPKPNSRAALRKDPAPPPNRVAFDRALDLVRERKWAEARTILVELAAGAPTDPRYRAYLHYVRGWEAFELGRPSEARAEFQRALSCDPGLGLAQWALGKTGLG